MKNIWIFVMALPVLAGCVPLAVGAGATMGVAAAQERGIQGAFTDTAIKATINDLWFKYDFETFAKLNLTVNQGRVLITGVVQNPEARVEAVRLAWQAKGVKEVINEIKVANSKGITGYTRDTWITTRLRTAITFNRDIQSINYSIDTVQGTVYLMGVARNQQELNRVMNIARTIPDVKQVVSYVKLAGQTVERNEMRNSVSSSSPPQPSSSNGFVDDQGAYQPGSYSSDNSGMAPVPLMPEAVQQEEIR